MMNPLWPPCPKSTDPKSVDPESTQPKTTHPKTADLRYEERGWPMFERRVAGGKGAGTGEFLRGMVYDIPPDFLLPGGAQKLPVWPTLEARALPPMAPDAFDAELAKRRITREEDRPALTKMYAAHFSVISRLERLDFGV